MLQKQFMASWVSIFKNQIKAQLELQEEPFISFQVSSIGLDGFPKNRTVVYRGFLFNDETNNVLTFTTDKRSEKYQELIHNDKFEAVFNLIGTRRQFRFKGFARIIDDEYKPVIDLSNIQPRNVGSTDSDESDDEDVSDDVLILNVDSHEEMNNQQEIPNNSTNCQQNPLTYNLISPSILKHQFHEHGSFTNLSELNVHAPTHEEYEYELTRQWESLSKSAKISFRKPAPKSPMTKETIKMLDSINRGVDGKKEVDGFKNFVVVGLFVESVDYYNLEDEKRYIFDKDKYDMWKEYEVCP